jgi:hypothetical protein
MINCTFGLAQYGLQYLTIHFLRLVEQSQITPVFEYTLLKALARLPYLVHLGLSIIWLLELEDREVVIRLVEAVREDLELLLT